MLHDYNTPSNAEIHSSETFRTYAFWKKRQPNSCKSLQLIDKVISKLLVEDFIPGLSCFSFVIEYYLTSQLHLHSTDKAHNFSNILDVSIIITHGINQLCIQTNHSVINSKDHLFTFYCTKVMMLFVISNNIADMFFEHV